MNTRNTVEERMMYGSGCWVQSKSAKIWSPLYSFDSTHPLSCLGSLMVEHLPNKQYICRGG